MKLFFGLALRNVFRNQLRSTVALLAIAVGCAALIVNSGIVLNIFRKLRNDAILGQYGHLQIYKRGYTDSHLGDPERYLMTPAEVAKVIELARSDPRVVQATRRRVFSGLISTGDRYIPFFGVAVEPKADAELSRSLTLRAGETLSESSPFGVVVGIGLAKKLNLKVGDELTLMSSTESGTLNSLHVRLRGAFEGGIKEYDDWTLKAPMNVSERLLDERTEQIVLLLDRAEDVENVRAKLANRFKKDGLELEIRSWNELALFYNQVVSLFGRELGLLRLIIGTIVILAIGNAIGMSIVERRFELATFRALGVGAPSIGALLILEAVFLGLIGSTLGVILGVSVSGLISAIGINYPSPPGSTLPFLGGVDMVPGLVVGAFAVSLSATILSAIIPVLRVSRMPIAGTLGGRRY